MAKDAQGHGSDAHSSGVSQVGQTPLNPLAGMTQAKWNAMGSAERDKVRDNGSLTPQLSGLEGHRVEATTNEGETRRFIVGKSTGWAPIHLEIKTSRSHGGGGADRSYKSVRSLGKVR